MGRDIFHRPCFSKATQSLEHFQSILDSSSGQSVHHWHREEFLCPLSVYSHSPLSCHYIPGKGTLLMDRCSAACRVFPIPAPWAAGGRWWQCPGHPPSSSHTEPQQPVSRVGSTPQCIGGRFCLTKLSQILAVSQGMLFLMLTNPPKRRAQC